MSAGARWPRWSCCCRLAAPAAAQTVVDGSDRHVPPEFLRERSKPWPTTGGFVDPYGAQFRRLQLGEIRPDYLCGWINPKNLLGSFTGFRPFYFDPKTNHFMILPPKDDILHEMSRNVIFQICRLPDGCPR